MHADTSSAPATSRRAKDLSQRMHLAYGKFDINIGKGEGSRKDKKQERSTTSESSFCGKVSSWWMALALFQRGNSHILLKAVLWLYRMEFWNTAQQRAPLITETHLRAPSVILSNRSVGRWKWESGGEGEFSLPWWSRSLSPQPWLKGSCQFYNP